MASSSLNNHKGSDSVTEVAETRGLKRSASHLDLEELPDELTDTDVQERRLKKPMSQCEVRYSYLCWLEMAPLVNKHF